MHSLLPPKSVYTVPLLDLEINSNKSRSNSSAGSLSDMVDGLFLLTTSDGTLVDDEMNPLIMANIRHCLLSPVTDPVSKRKVFENAIQANYKKLLNELFDDIRKAGLKINLDSVDLSGLNLSDLNLSGVSAVRANFSNAKITRTNFSGASLVGADLSGVTARKTNFERAVFECTLANRFVTDNPWLAKSYALVTDTLARNVEITNVYLHGIGRVTESGKKIFILPARMVRQPCCSCVIL